MIKEKMIQIEEDKLRQLLYDSYFLEMLEEAGVDNWIGYGDNYNEFVANALDISEEEVYDRELRIEDIVDKEIKKYKIAREKFNPSIIETKGNLCLSYKTFLDKKATDKDIEICMFNDDGSRFVIASFDYNEKEECYELVSCCDRLNTKDINWNNFGYLVQKGYKILER